jgi:Zn-finger protein
MEYIRDACDRKCEDCTFPHKKENYDRVLWGLKYFREVHAKKHVPMRGGDKKENENVQERLCNGSDCQRGCTK